MGRKKKDPEAETSGKDQRNGMTINEMRLIPVCSEAIKSYTYKE